MKSIKVLKGLLMTVLLLCTFLCATALTVTAADDSTTHTHPICGATHTDIGDHTGECEPVTWTAWNGTDNIVYDENNTAYVYLTGNAERTSKLEIGDRKTLYLCLNGHSLIRITDSEDAFDAVIYALETAKVVLCDCIGGGKITHSDNALGRGVRIGLGSTVFTMYGGEITGNRAGSEVLGADGAGVEIQNGTFTMYGGKITNNRVNKQINYGGGGVCAQSSGKFIMYGGEISDNYSDTWGGGVIAWGGYVTIKGGTISGNTAAENGGGIITNLKLEISGNANITNNTAKDGNGGGIYFYSTYSGSASMIVSDSVKISGNTASDGNDDGTGGLGGGIYVEKGNFTLSGGSITGNTATGNGGGIYFNGSTFKISGKLDISENSKSGNANNVFLAKNKAISVADELTVSEPIGVTTETTADSSYVRIAYGNAEYATPDKFNYENSDIDISVIEGSSSVTLIACAHNWDADWQTDSAEHWHQCTICKGKKDKAEHSGGTATCTSKAACEVCGKAYGNTLAHNFTEDWKADENEHWHKCSDCDATTDKAEHSGGTVTCTSKAACEICGEAYGELDSDNHAGGTEIRGTEKATDQTSGHTGNVYCKGCDGKLADGVVIPATSSLSLDKKDDLTAAADAIEKFLSDNTEIYTDEQKELINDSVNAIKAAVKSIENAENAIAKAKAMPAADATRPDDKTAIDAYESAKQAYDALTDDEKRMAGDETAAALTAMFNALTAYDITYGNGSTWKSDDENGLTFTVNGYHEKFTEIVVNGEVVDKEYYETEAGSTVITLKTEYLQTLPAETYTIIVRYIDGETDGNDTFTVAKKAPDVSSSSSDSELTEENDVMLWICISIICLIILIILIVLIIFLLTSFKKREKEKKNKDGKN